MGWWGGGGGAYSVRGKRAYSRMGKGGLIVEWRGGGRVLIVG